MKTKSWEDAHLLPGVPLERCSWCRRPNEQCYVLLFENTANIADPTVIESEVLCPRCAQSLAQYIEMRKEGLSRKIILRDFGVRNDQNKPSDWVLSQE